MRTVVQTLWHALKNALEYVGDRGPSAGFMTDRRRGIRPRRAAPCGLPGRLRLALVTVAVALALPSPSSASSAADGEIRIGNTLPYSGPAAAYGIIGKTIAAYFTSINDQGGINGRKINFISYDDAYNAQKTVELTRKLVVDDKVLLIFAGLGTAPNLAVRPY
jgi:ABC-type branched-subunit amino acid transport system substrate-binding protein